MPIPKLILKQLLLKGRVVYDLQTKATQSFSWHRVTECNSSWAGTASTTVMFAVPHTPTKVQHSGHGTQTQRFFPSFRSSGTVQACAYPLAVEQSYVDYCTGSPQNVMLNRPLLATQQLWLSLQRKHSLLCCSSRTAEQHPPNSSVKPQNTSKITTVLPSILGNTQTIS